MAGAQIGSCQALPRGGLSNPQDAPASISLISSFGKAQSGSHSDCASEYVIEKPVPSEVLFLKCVSIENLSVDPNSRTSFFQSFNLFWSQPRTKEQGFGYRYPRSHSRFELPFFYQTLKRRFEWIFSERDAGPMHNIVSWRLPSVLYLNLDDCSPSWVRNSSFRWRGNSDDRIGVRNIDDSTHFRNHVSPQLALRTPAHRANCKQCQDASYHAQTGQNPIGEVCRSDSSFQILFGMRLVISVSLCILSIFLAYFGNARWWCVWGGLVAMGLGLLLLLAPIHWEWFLCADWSSQNQQTEYRQMFQHDGGNVSQISRLRTATDESISGMAKGNSRKGGGGNAHGRAVAKAVKINLALNSPNQLQSDAPPPQLSGLRRISKSHSSILQWARTVGIASIAFGGFGLMSIFFVWSVVLLYFGIAVLICDLWFERFRKADYLRFVIISVLLVFVCAFTKGVVLHDDPLDYVNDIYPKNGVITVTLYNTSASDYRDLDITIQPIPSTQIDSAKEEIGVAGVEIFDPGKVGAPKELQSGQSIEMSNGRIFLNFQRVRCATLPHDSPIQFKLNLKGGVPMPERVHIVGTYYGKFQSRTIDINSGLSKTEYGIFNRP
jgi:hypothetical protein